MKKDRFVAALLALFLGGFGIHKFYLGYNAAGLFYFLFSWTLIPTVLSFFDFLGLVITPDAIFDRRHNLGYLPTSSAGLESQHRVQDITAAIGDLKRLYEDGAITVGEYEEKRQKLLNKL